MSHRLCSALLVCTFFAAVICPVAWADNPKLPPKPTEFELLIGRIRKVAASGDWKQPGWKDARLEDSLDKLVEAAKATSGKQALKLPVKFENVSAAADPRPGRMQGQLQVVAENAEVAFANKSILLVDGSVRISHAADCIIIARGMVAISGSNRNLIVAGQHVNLSFDGMDGMRGGAGAGGVAPPLADGSLVVSGGSMHISHAQGSTCSAPKLIDISHAREVAFLASTELKMSHQQGCTEHKDFATPFPLPATAGLPAAVFTIKQIVAPDDRTKQLLTVERNGIEYVLRPGAKLTDEKGQPLAGWANWSVGFITREAALFTDGQEDLTVHLPE